MIIFVVFYLLLVCGMIVFSPAMSLSIPFPFWVAPEQRGSQG